MTDHRYHTFKACVPGALALALWCIALSAGAGPFGDMMRDPEDGALDGTRWLTQASGFLPVPIIITEPAVGVGGGLAVAFFHDSISNRIARLEGGDLSRLAPPSISAVAAFATENGSWGGGAFHSGIWKDDTIRYQGALAGASMNLKFYTAPPDGSEEKPLKYNIKAIYLLQELLFRLGESDVFIGPKFTALFSDSVFDIGEIVPGIDPQELKANDGAAGGVVKFDSRDNSFTPNRGLFGQTSLMMHGGAFEYAHLNSEWNGYLALHRTVILGLRGEGDFTTGGVPFYALPFINLRGIPAMRYQGRNMVLGELELRWDVRPRWSVVGFTGAGRVADDLGSLGESKTEATYGGGFRYLLARGFGLRGGIDVARGPEDTAVYLTIGSPWGR